MSGYRSLKRVLGETNLERKCRMIFGICVTALIVLAFWSAGQNAAGLIRDTANHKGRDLVRLVLFRIHWQWWTRQYEGGKYFETVERLNQSLTQEAYQHRIISLDPKTESISPVRLVFPPGDAVEEQIVQQLKQRYEEQLLSQPKPQEPQPAIGSSNDQTFGPDPDPIFKPIPAQDQGKYYYYQVVRWENDCNACHDAMHGGTFADSAAMVEGSVFDGAATPFRVVRITMPYEATRSAMNRTWAVLIAVGIVTVSLSMLAFWAVVRYVVVKPLTHLRDVSEAVSTGDLAQRADLHTGDEFEDLAASFNKMLRHLLEAQGELRAANLKLDGKVDELARLNMQLHEMNRLKGEFLANMSHELRTPLNSIIGFSEVLQNIEGLSDKQRRYAQNIQKSGRNLLDMINDILDLAKMEAGKMEVRLSEFRIDSLIANQCDVVRPMAEDKNIDLDVEIASDLPLLYQDQPKVQQILTNLLSNAIKFTPEGGRITVGARGDSRGRIEFWVSDTGVGIPDSEKEIIFEKFRQGKAVLGQDLLTREYSGTGLGLSIVKELCKLLGGEVSVESELGKGSTFRVVIPWMRADQPVASTKLSAKLDEITRPRKSEEPEATAVR